MTNASAESQPSESRPSESQPSEGPADVAAVARLRDEIAELEAQAATADGEREVELRRRLLEKQQRLNTLLRAAMDDLKAGDSGR